MSWIIRTPFFGKKVFGKTKNRNFCEEISVIKRARDGIRTRDPNLGKVVLHPWATRAYSSFRMKRVMGIEPTYPAWKAGVLPLNYTRRWLALIFFSVLLTAVPHWQNVFYRKAGEKSTPFLKKIEKIFKILKKVKIQGKWREWTSGE